MPWYLLLIVIWQSFLLLITLLLAGKTLRTLASPVSIVSATTTRGLCTWGLLAGGASVPWTIAITILAFLDLLGDAYNIQHKRPSYVGPGTLLLAIGLYGGTIALALTARR